MKDFYDDGFCIVEEAISSDACFILSQYILFEKNNEKEYDNVTESLMLMLLPVIEMKTGEELLPTYSKYQFCRGGEKIFLSSKDSSEITAIVCLGYEYNGANYSYGINVGSEEIYMHPGDILIFNKSKVSCIYDILDADKDCFYIQAELNYVDAFGNNSDLLYDGRKGLGEEDSDEC